MLFYTKFNILLVKILNYQSFNKTKYTNKQETILNSKIVFPPKLKYHLRPRYEGNPRRENIRFNYYC